MSASGKWFVMMFSQNGQCVMPLVADEDIVMLWDTESEANEAARGNAFANAFGFQTHQIE